MDKETKLADCISTPESLQEYLRFKAGRHSNYKLYAKMNRIIGIRDELSLYLNTGVGWNDTTDKNAFNSVPGKILFGKCFSYSGSENVAMWMLYGGIHKNGGMIDFTKKGMQAILTVPEIEIGCFEENAFGEKKFQSGVTLQASDFEIYLTDILYFHENDSGMTIRRHNEKVDGVTDTLLNPMMNCKKVYPWKYENECRLVISVDRDGIDEKWDTAKIDLRGLDLGVSLERIYYSPNYDYTKMESYEDVKPSRLESTIEWNLCKGCSITTTKTAK